VCAQWNAGSRHAAVMKETSIQPGADGSFGRLVERNLMRMWDVADSGCSRGQVSRNSYHTGSFDTIHSSPALTRSLEIRSVVERFTVLVTRRVKSVRICLSCAIQSVAVYVSFCLMKNDRK
jgi:hypothetical protein